MATSSKTITLTGRFPMHRGGFLETPTVAYETWGELNAQRDNAVLLFTGLSPSAHAASSVDNPSTGWWEDMLGPGLPIDIDRYFVVCINSLGSCFGSTGPASVDPLTGEFYRLHFPTLTLEDVAAAGHAVVEHLEIDVLHTVMGASMGGMSALAYCVKYPHATDRFISISAAVRALPFSIAVRSLQREMIRRDPKWMHGEYDFDAPPLDGQTLARKLGMITYRSAEEWEIRFARERMVYDQAPRDMFGGDFAVESYLRSTAERFTGNFDANCYLYLSRASDLFDLAEHGGSLSAGFTHIDLKKALVIGVESDILFPLQQQKVLAEGLAAVVPDVSYRPLDCIKGHDSFLVEMDAFRPEICRFFESCQ